MIPMPSDRLANCPQNALSAEVTRLVDAHGRLETAEAAALIGCSDWMVRKLYDEGELTGVRIGKHRRIDKASAEAYRDRDKKAAPGT